MKPAPNRMPPNRMPAANNGTSIDALVDRDPSVAVAPDPCGPCFQHVAPVLPPQGIGVFDTCLIGRLAVPFISPAIRMRASCLFSIWNAWPPSTKNSEDNSAAPIESRAEFLYMMHLLLVGRVDTSSGHASPQSTCQYFFSRLSYVYPLICWVYLARLSRWRPLRVPWQSTPTRREFDYDGIRRDAVFSKRARDVRDEREMRDEQRSSGF